MGLERGDDVGLAITVHVVGVDLRSAVATIEEMFRMEFPFWIAFEAGGLFVPTRGKNEILFTVAVDVIAEAMSESLIAFVGADCVELPRLSRVAPIRLCIPGSAAGQADQHGLPGAQQIAEGGRFIIGDIKDLMSNPMPIGRSGLAARILIPARVFARESDDQDVVPAIVFEAVGKGEEVLRILIISLVGLDRHVFMSAGEIWPFIPVGA